MGLDNDTTSLLDLDGLAVQKVERLADGTRRVRLTTADESARACPSCGVFAVRVKAGRGGAGQCGIGGNSRRA